MGKQKAQKVERKEKRGDSRTDSVTKKVITSKVERIQWSSCSLARCSADGVERRNVGKECVNARLFLSTRIASG